MKMSCHGRYPFSQSTGPTEAERGGRPSGGLMECRLDKEVKIFSSPCPWWNVQLVQGQRPPPLRKNLKMREKWSIDDAVVADLGVGKWTHFIYIRPQPPAKTPSAADYNTSSQQRRRRRRKMKTRKTCFFRQSREKFLTPRLSMKPATWGRVVRAHISHFLTTGYLSRIRGKIWNETKIREMPSETATPSQCEVGR
jgi:hypothetical protein